MSKINAKFILIGLIVLGLVSFGVYKTNQSRVYPIAPQGVFTDTSKTQHDEYVLAQDNKILVPQLISDLHITSDIRVGLVEEADNTYVFDLSDPVNGGGILLIAQLWKDGHFIEVWRGQDDPPCSALNKAQYPVPTTLKYAEYCFDGNTSIKR